MPVLCANSFAPILAVPKSRCNRSLMIAPMTNSASRFSLLSGPTPVQVLSRFRAMLGGGPRLLAKRDDAIPFGFGGNKIRKLEYVIAQALAADADTIVTVGG